MFAFTSNLTFAVASAMMDVRRFCPSIATEIVLLHDGKLGRRDARLLNQILPTRLVEYNFPILDNEGFNQDLLGYFSKMVFAKFECLRLLDEYETVVFSDYDILLQGDITEIARPAASGLRMIREGTVRSQLLERARSIQIENYQMDETGICSSLFVFQDHLPRYDEMYRFLYDCTERYAEHLYLLDQFGFSLMLQEFGLLDSEKLEKSVYSAHPHDIEHVKEAKILHAFGQPKFWNGLKDDRWDANYHEWRAMGGSGLEGPSLGARARRVAKKLLGRVRE